MNTNWTLRRAVPNDSATIASHACYRPEDAGLRMAYAAWVHPRIDSEKYVGMLAVSDGEVVGGAGVVLLDWGPTRANPDGVMGRSSRSIRAAHSDGRALRERLSKACSTGVSSLAFESSTLARPRKARASISNWVS